MISVPGGRGMRSHGTRCRAYPRAAALLFSLALVAGLSGRSWGQASPAQGSAPSPQVLSGEVLYQQHCALCHGVKGRDATVFPRPIWGPGHDLAKFQHARGLFEYLQLLMPFDDPAKLDDTAKTAITAYILAQNGNLRPQQSLPSGGDLTPVR